MRRLAAIKLNSRAKVVWSCMSKCLSVNWPPDWLAAVASRQTLLVDHSCYVGSSRTKNWKAGIVRTLIVAGGDMVRELRTPIVGNSLSATAS